MRRAAATAAPLEEKIDWQRQQRGLEQKRTQLRRRIFDRQDEIDKQREVLIVELEDALRQSSECVRCFVIEWEMNDYHRRTPFGALHPASADFCRIKGRCMKNRTITAQRTEVAVAKPLSRVDFPLGENKGLGHVHR